MKTHLVCTGGFNKDFIKKWGCLMEPHMKKGWKTWSYTEQYNERIEHNTLVLEDNKYEINFLPNNFKEIK